MMNKTPDTQYPIHALLQKRWSPRAFSGKTVSTEALGSLFEAARWAASCYNEQPWRYIVARKEDTAEYDRLMSCLVEGNQAWAMQAPVLMLAVTKKTFTFNDKPNAHARHDLGLATAGMMLQAAALDLYMHAMGGILPEKAAELYRVPDDFQVATGIALGYLGDPDSLAEPMKTTELEARVRKPLEEIVFASSWEKPAGFL
ncbi:MAG: nitroreductase family protein [Gammaproteobacteria bacterium]|jgi:nitroreductase